MTDAWVRFPVFVLASYVVFGGILAFVLRRRERGGLIAHILRIGFIVIVAGMVFAKFGQNAGWPWWIYYTVPMLLTVFLPPVYFRMTRYEVLEYLVLAFMSAPAIHFVFSFLAGWHDYMPFLRVPSMWEIGV